MSNNVPKKPENGATSKTPPMKGTPGPVKPAPSASGPVPPAKAPPVKVPPLFRNIDWLTFAITTLFTFVGYYLTLAPQVTLEDSGELATASMYAGVPHPPGYPVWTIYTWLFTVLFPVSNIAYRVGMSSGVAGAFRCWIVSMLVSQGSRRRVDGMHERQALERWL